MLLTIDSLALTVGYFSLCFIVLFLMFILYVKMGDLFHKYRESKNSEIIKKGTTYYRRGLMITFAKDVKIKFKKRIVVESSLEGCNWGFWGLDKTKSKQELERAFLEEIVNGYEEGVLEDLILYQKYVEKVEKI